jgi:hypothetical protein
MDNDFIPFQLKAASIADLALHFDGDIPKPGDKVELFCYERGEFFVNLKWRVVQEEKSNENKRVGEIESR